MHDLRTRVKYHNVRTMVDGITFDSKREAARYRELKLMQRAGVITGLDLQPKIELIPPFKVRGKTQRGIYYIADFRYWENGKIVIEDAKGVRTRDYLLKRKMLLFQNPGLDFREV